jgi:hypothetical protein
MFKTLLLKHQARSFGHCDFENLEIVSDFEIRISDLWITLEKSMNAVCGLERSKPARLPQQ